MSGQRDPQDSRGRRAARRHRGDGSLHVVALAGDILDQARQRVQRQSTGHGAVRGRPTRDDALCALGRGCLPDRQHPKLQMVFVADEHVEIEATWRMYQRIVGAYRNA